jgi:hypothetical protein
MALTDMSAVAARRAEIVRKLGELDAVRANLETEDGDLAVTERVLKRLDELLQVDTSRSYAPRYVVSEPMHQRAFGAIKSIIATRIGRQS